MVLSQLAGSEKNGGNVSFYLGGGLVGGSVGVKTIGASVASASIGKMPICAGGK